MERQCLLAHWGIQDCDGADAPVVVREYAGVHFYAARYPPHNGEHMKLDHSCIGRFGIWAEGSMKWQVYATKIEHLYGSVDVVFRYIYGPDRESAGDPTTWSSTDDSLTNFLNKVSFHEARP